MRYLLLLCLLTSHVLFAQPQYNIEYITTENGLPSDGVKGLEIDKKMGFLWIATESGLVRYNGHQFTLFNADNFSFLPADKIFPISKKPNGQIFAIAGGRVLFVEANKLVPGSTAPGHANDLINVYLDDGPAKGSQTGINNYDHFLPINAHKCIVARADTLWEIRSGNGHKTFLTALPGNILTFAIGSNIFVYRNDESFQLWDTIGKRLVPVSTNSNGGADDQMPTGKKHIYWEPGMDKPVILCGTNAWEIDYIGGTLRTTLICTEIPQNFSIKHVQPWKEANILFLGTASKGLIIIRKNHLFNVKKNKSGFDEPNAFYSQLALPNGNILINTGDVLGLSRQPQKKLPIEGPFNNNIYLTKDSVLWYSFRDSLYFTDYKTGERKFLCMLPGSYNIGFAHSQGKDYIASYKGIYILNRTHLDTACNYRNIGDIFDMVELRPGLLAVASSKGIYNYDIAANKIDTVLITAAPARALWKYKDYLFIGTYGDGIFIYKNGVLKRIPLDNNRYLSYTHCFMLDSKGFCWMSTNRGLFKAQLNDLLNAFEKGTEYIYYHFFGRNEGMDITEMNGGCTPCAIWLANRSISFPTMDGALWVDPYIPAHMPDSNIFVDQVIVNGHRIDPLSNDSLYFDSRTNDISLNLGFSAWCDKENLYLQYKVVPYSDKWEKIDALHPVIRLNNLPSGQYTLYIRKITGFGEQNYVTHTFSFEIQAPWYMRWWGQAALILIFMIIVTVISVLANRSSLRRQIRLRSLLDKKTEEILEQNEKLEKNDRIKTRLISIISHDIITPLKFLHMTSKYLSERKSSLSENMQAETLEEVVNTSRELELLSTNILNWIKYQNEERRIVKEKINLHEVVEQVFIVLRSLAHKNNTELVNDVPADLVMVQFVDPLRIIIYNLVVNAINFTKQGSITLSSSSHDNFIQVSVQDTGMGMTRSQITNLKSDMMIISGTNVNKRSGNGLGYLIIKDLLKMLNGEFDIESKINAGTTVSITFPAK